MLTRFLELQAAIVAKEKELNSLSDDEIMLAEEVSTSLKQMKDITVMLCSEETPTASMIMPVHFRLVNSVLVVSENDSNPVKEMKNIMRNDLNEKYQHVKNELNCISVMNPRFKNLP